MKHRVTLNDEEINFIRNLIVKNWTGEITERKLYIKLVQYGIKQGELINE